MSCGIFNIVEILKNYMIKTIPDDLSDTYQEYQYHDLCDNRVWAGRPKVLNFWGPEISVHFKSDSRANGRGFMLGVGGM